VKLLFCDLETYSETPIKAGTHRYSEGAEVMLWTYAFDDGEGQCWDVTTGAPMPDDLAAGLADPDVLTVWHNGGMFDTVVLPHALGIDIPLPRIHDTMVQALAHSLPGGLDQLCEILGVDSSKAKHKGGKNLILFFCKPTGANMKLRRRTRETHPKEWAQFIDYAKSDISAMREVYRKVPKWNTTPAEVQLWQLDQRINRRGMCIDTDLAQAALRAIEREQKHLSSRAYSLTDGYIAAATQRDRLLEFILAEYGYGLADMKGATVEKFLDRMGTSLEPELVELLNVRLRASTSSTAKYKTLLGSVSSDGRLRGTKQFCGASRTGRWSGKVFQPDNLPRPTMSNDEIEFGIDAMKADTEDMLFDNVMALTSSAIRGCIVAPEGKKLVIADLSNIEGRMLAWLAGEEWKLQAFRDFDGGIGADLYKLAYAKSFGIRPDEVTKDQRQVGKVLELSMGYAGGVGAFLTFATAYNIDLEAMAVAARGNIPKATLEEAEDFVDWWDRTKQSALPISVNARVVCEAFKRLWREAHPRVVSWWRELEDKTREAIDSPGKTIIGTHFKTRRDGAWLRVQLPSGRALCYPHPQIDEKDQISYMGVNQFSRKWCRLRTYSGKLAENITQAASRDILAANMPEIDATGYAIILSVHDELLTETDDSPIFNDEDLAAMMSKVPAWAEGVPLAAAGFETRRYCKG
jgi:DNA polymerase